MPIVMFPATFLGAVSTMLIPEFSRYYVKKDYKKIRLYTKKLLLGSLAFSLFLFAIFLFFGKKLGILIYNDEAVRNIY